MLRSPFSDAEIPDVPLTDFVLARAGGLGDKRALIDGPSGRTIAYAQLAESVRVGAAGLAERGFGKGDIFAHYAPNLPEYAVAFHAVATVGGVARRQRRVFDFETHQFKKHARPLPLQLARPSHAGVRYWARSPSAAKDADSLRVDCERVAGSEPAPPSG